MMDSALSLLLDLFLLRHVPILWLSDKIQNPQWKLISDKQIINTITWSHTLFKGQSYTKMYYFFIWNSTLTRCLLLLLLLLLFYKSCHPKPETSCCPTVLDICKPFGQRRGLLGTLLGRKPWLWWKWNQTEPNIIIKLDFCVSDLWILSSWKNLTSALLFLPSLLWIVVFVLSNILP